MYLSLEGIKTCLDEALSEEPEPLRRILTIEGVVRNGDDALTRLLECNGGQLTIIIRAIPKEFFGLDATPQRALEPSTHQIETTEQERKAADLWPPQ